MSQDTDRIPVPTNGRGPHPAPAPLAAAGPAEPPAAPSELELSVAFTPKQIAVGFGILASLLLLLAGLVRRHASGGAGGRDGADRG